MKRISLLITTFLLVSCVCSVMFGQSIVVNTDNYKQTIDMVGGDMERSADAIQSATNKDDILQWSFGDINFNVCRVQYDKNQEMVEGTKNWSFYSKQVTTMQGIKALNPDIKFFATMRSDYDGYGDDNNLPDWISNYSTKAMDTDKYAIFLADYIEYMDQQGVPIAIISTAKEWMWYVRASSAEDVINKLKTELETRGVAMPLISDQGFWSISQGVTYLNEVEELGTVDLYDSFCSHNYANESTEMWVKLIEQSNAMGKRMYDDETSTGSGSPTYGVERDMYKQIGEYVKKANRYESGLCGEIFFEIWSRGIDKETRSIYFPAGGSGTRLRGYYMMKHFSNNVLDSRYVTAEVTSMSKVYTISFRKDDTVVLWVINESTTSYSRFPIAVDAFQIDGDINVHYWTDNTDIAGLDITLQANGNVFESAMAGESMACYIFNVKDSAENIATNGVASQSSTDGTSTASLAIDGSTDGAFDNGSVSLTNSEANAWWSVELAQADTIGVIELYNRTDDCCSAVLSNFTVSALDANDNVVFTETYTTAPDPMLSINTGGVIAKKIKIQSLETTALALAEVKVYQGVIIEKLSQTIDFAATNTVTYTSELYTPTAVSSSGLDIEYTSSNTDVAIIDDGQVQLVGVGETTLSASVSESAIYTAASTVQQVLTVVKADQSITFTALPQKYVGDGSFLPGAIVDTELPLTYTSSNTEVATIQDSRIIIVGEGTSTITASQVGNSFYNAIEATQVLNVGPSQSGGEEDSSELSLLPINDTYARAGTYSSENYGSETELLIKETSSANFHRKAYLQFDLYDLSSVQKAELWLYATGVGTCNIQVSETSDNWTETSLTWDNVPSAGSAISSQSVETKGEYYVWDVTDYVTSEMDGDDLASFVVADISTAKNNISFTSKEADENQPLLVITAATPSNVISDEASLGLVKVFPNPAINQVSIVSANTIQSITLTTMSGRQIMNTTYGAQNEVNIDLSHVLKGIYFLQVNNDKAGSYTTTLCVE